MQSTLDSRTAARASNEMPARPKQDLRAWLAAHQATPLPAPIAPRTRAQKTRNIRAISRPGQRARHTTTPSPALPRTHAVMPPCATRPRDMTTGIPRPRLVAPH